MNNEDYIWNNFKIKQEDIEEAYEKGINKSALIKIFQASDIVCNESIDNESFSLVRNEITHKDELHILKNNITLSVNYYFDKPVLNCHIKMNGTTIFANTGSIACQSGPLSIGDKFILNDLDIGIANVSIYDCYKWTNNKLSTKLLKTDIEIQESTSYTKEYHDTYFTCLSKYGVNNKQIKLLTTPKYAIEAETPEVPGHYFFKYQQTYAPGCSSNKYLYWATKGAENVQIVKKINSITEPQIELIDENTFKINDEIFYKGSNAIIYIAKRGGFNTIEDIKYDSWTDTGRLGVDETQRQIGCNVRSRFASGRELTIAYPVYSQSTSQETIKATLSNSMIYFKEFTSSEWTLANNNNIPFGSIEEQTFTKESTSSWKMIGSTYQSGARNRWTGIAQEWKAQDRQGNRYTIPEETTFISWPNNFEVNIYREIKIKLKNWKINGTTDIWSNDCEIILNDSSVGNWNNFYDQKALSISKDFYIRFSDPLKSINHTFQVINYQKGYELYNSGGAIGLYYDIRYNYTNKISNNETSDTYAILVYNPNTQN